MFSDNIIKQDEEIEALSSIYGDDWSTESDVTRTFRIRVVENQQEALLYVTMPPEYPSKSPPKFELSAPWMDRKEKVKLHQALNDVYLECIGETVIYQWVEKVREILLTMKPEKKEIKQKQDRRSPDVVQNLSQNVPCPEIIHGEVIVDRKSIFQGHLAVVKSLEEVNVVLQKLKENKKIMNATHNMYAYRIERKTDKGTTILQDCDEDGEAHAGGRMMKLIQILDQKNTLVVISRWYGGIQLGPDRFRHISNAMRQVIEQAGLLKK
ncbi:protein IMPACT-B-like isoform X2 [Choristoneura fumiferana]|uniref:protein IMPACT-B-like isoform X2 n=1 Tax=Choristoneura fumiferana TaxID=7141 RepID=UPI003D15CCEB